VSWIPSPIIDHVTGRKRKWAEDEDIKLRDAIQMYGSKSWDEVAALAPGIVRRQFWFRWHRALDPISIDQVRQGRNRRKSFEIVASCVLAC
jgi:hypothetical protein